MKHLVNTLVALALCAAALLVGMQLRSERAERRAVIEVRAAIEEINRQIRRQAALGGAELNGRGWPKTIDPSWFGETPPHNVLLDDERPWLEVAPPEHADLEHPPQRIAITRRHAAFWYNPGAGVVRARAPLAVSDRRTTDLYNRINGSTLRSIFADIPDEKALRRAVDPLGDMVSADVEEVDLDELMDPTRPRRD